MRRPLPHLVLACALALASPVAAPASAPPSRCHARPGEQLVEHSAQAIVLWSRKRAAVTGCLRSSGRRRWLFHAAAERDPGGERLRGLHLAGTFVIYKSYDSDAEASLEEVTVEDLSRSGSARVIGRVIHDYGDHTPVPSIRFPSLAVRADGTAAIVLAGIEPHGSLHVVTRAGHDRMLDEGDRLHAVAFGGKLLRWRHGDQVRTAVATPADACPPAFADGTGDVGVVQKADVVTACNRATGQLARVSGAQLPYSGEPSPARIGGPFVAVPLGHEAVARLDTRNGTVIAVNAPGVRNVIVDDAGSMVWASWFGPFDGTGHGELWARDGAGTRLVQATTTDLPWLWRDGAVVDWREPEGPFGSIVLSP